MNTTLDDLTPPPNASAEQLEVFRAIHPRYRAAMKKLDAALRRRYAGSETRALDFFEAAALLAPVNLKTALLDAAPSACVEVIVKGLDRALGAGFLVHPIYTKEYVEDKMKPQVALYVAQVHSTPVSELVATKITRFYNDNGPRWARDVLPHRSEKASRTLNRFYTIALDILVAPVSVAAAERAHSIHRNVFNKSRRKLGHETALTCQLFAANKEHYKGFMDTISMGV